MNITTKIKASDIGYFDHKETGGTQWKWRRLDDNIVVTDRQNIDGPKVLANGLSEGTRCFGLFRLELFDTNAGVCHVTTCGTKSKSGTRNHSFATMSEAMEYALKWLDYRFKVEVTDEITEAVAA